MKEKQAQKAIYDKILDGTTFSPINVSVNFNDSSVDGSPLVFGGVQTPLSQHKDAWDKIQSVGVTSIRKGFFIEREVPNSTIEDYKKNKDDIQNSDKWNKTVINNLNILYQDAKNRGIKTIGIVSYAPSWLTYSGMNNGVPKDWEIYEDIVGKIYRLHRPFLDYVEIWNESTLSMFLDLTSSSYNREEAYVQIFYHAAKAIRNVDSSINDGRKIPIDGPVAHTPDSMRMLEVLLSNRNARDYLNFISYHNYGGEEPSWTQYKNILDRYEMGNLPIFITEWNYSPEENIPNAYNYGEKAIVYTGDKLLDFLKGGIAGANYYLLESLKKPRIGDTDYMGFYRWVNNQAILVSQSNSWRILSSDLKLGRGPSKIIPIETPSDIKGIAFTNSEGQKGIAFVNSSTDQKVIQVMLTNKEIKSQVYTKLYFASQDSSYNNTVYSEIFNVNKDTNFRIIVPPLSITGAIISPNDNIIDKMKNSILN